MNAGGQPPDGSAVDAAPVGRFRHPARAVDWDHWQVSWAKTLLGLCIGRQRRWFCASLSFLKASFEGSCRLLEMKIFELPGWFRRRLHLDVASPLGALPVMEMLSPAVPWSRSHLLRCCSSLRLHLGSTQCGYYVTGASCYGQSPLAERSCHQLFLSKERLRIGAA